MDQLDERGGVDTRMFDRFPVDVAMTPSGEHRTKHLDRPCMRHQSDRSAIGLLQKPFAEAGQPDVDVGHRLTPSPTDLVDVYAGGRRLFPQVAPGPTLQFTKCLFAQLRRRCDGQPQLLSDHLGGLLGSEKVGGNQPCRAAAAQRGRSLAGLATSSVGEPYSRRLPLDASGDVPFRLAITQQEQTDHAPTLGSSPGPLERFSLDHR